MKKRGLTLLELLIVISMLAIVVAGITQGFVAGVEVPMRLRESREDRAEQRDFEDRLIDWISHATLHRDATSQTAYFIGNTGEGEGSSVSSVADTLTFTVAGRRLPASALINNEDFETTNERLGPMGGTTEVSISPTPVGAAPQSGGLYLRVQTPADGDTTQGGRETLLLPSVENVRFEFWDGLSWLAEWDTREMNTPRLPAAVRVVIQPSGGGEERALTIRIPLSDVTTENPLSTGGETG